MFKQFSCSIKVGYMLPHYGHSLPFQHNIVNHPLLHHQTNFYRQDIYTCYCLLQYIVGVYRTYLPNLYKQKTSFTLLNLCKFLLSNSIWLAVGEFLSFSYTVAFRWVLWVLHIGLLIVMCAAPSAKVTHLPN